MLWWERICWLLAVSALTAGCTSLLPANQSAAPLAPQPTEHYIIQCDIFDQSGKILRHFGGVRCVFFADGSLVAGTNLNLTFYNPDMSVRWSKPIETHHQLNLSSDGQRLLVMSSSIHQVPDHPSRVRFDKLLVYDLAGNELLSFSFFEQRALLERHWPHRESGYFSMGKPMRKHVPPDVDVEYSHANSFYEIPQNKAALENEVFAAGNYLVNVLLPNHFIVIDRALTKILWVKPEPRAPGRGSAAHDVQMQASGWLLFYANISSTLEGAYDYSTIDEVNPITGEIRTLYRAQPPTSFFSTMCGGVQRFTNNHLLISDVTNGGRLFEADAQGKELWSFYYPSIDPKTGKPMIFQQAKRADLSEFLRNNKGL